MPTAPQERADLKGQVRFAWNYAGTLQPGQAFEVRIWKEGQEHKGAAEETTALELTINLDEAPGIKDNKNVDGEYLWAVAVIQRTTGARIGRESEPRHFKYTQPSDCEGGCNR